MEIILYYVHCTVGWSVIELFSISESGYRAVDLVYFCESNSKKSASLAAGAAKY